MATFTYITSFREVEIDNDNNFVTDYETNLPHHDIIAAAMCKSWNKMHMEKFYDGILTDKIESATMRCRKRNEESEAVISIKMKTGVRLTARYREAIVEQTAAQLSDGWGETFFGPINIMTDNSCRFYAE